MKILSALLILLFLVPSLSFAKRRRTSSFKRRHAVVLNTQSFNYSKADIEGSFGIAYAYNMGNFEVQPHISFKALQESKKLKLKDLLLGLNIHLNIIENRRGKRFIPYILAGGSYSLPENKKTFFIVNAGSGFKYFLTSRLAINPEIFYSHIAIKPKNSPKKYSIKTNFHFRYYF